MSYVITSTSNTITFVSAESFTLFKKNISKIETYVSGIVFFLNSDKSHDFRISTEDVTTVNGVALSGANLAAKTTDFLNKLNTILNT